MTVDRRVVHFKGWHYGWLQTGIELGAQELNNMELQNSWTAVVEGEPIACAGIMTYWPGRYHAWAYMSPATGRHMRWLTAETQKVLQKVEGRLEMAVLQGFKAGHKWARVLGFSVEAPLMKRYGPDGADYVGYVRFN